VQEFEAKLNLQPLESHAVENAVQKEFKL
jgi:hypothetical protein